jgi:nucleotide-binding universal stress UspA family protein
VVHPFEHVDELHRHDSRMSNAISTIRASTAPVWQEIAETLADVIGAAVIVIGSRGLTGVRELPEGSLSHEVAERTRRLVLVVSPNQPPLS